MDGDSFVIRRCVSDGVRAVEARSSRTFARHTHDEHGIGLMVAGAHRSWSGCGAVEAGAGDLITVNPGEVHDGAPIGPARTWTMLYFSRAAARDLAEALAEGAAGDVEFERPVLGDRRRAPAFRRAYLAFTRGHPDSAEENALRLLAGLWRTRREGRAPDVPGLARAKARIDDAPAAPTSLGALAAEAGLSRWQLIRGFSRLTGLTPHAYRVQRRVDAARALIAAGAGLADAAAASGFADQSHFTRAFVRRYGLTPGAWAAATR